MSAYVVSKEHIDAIVRLAIQGPSDRAPNYPGDGWYGPRWYNEEPQEDWAIGDYSNHAAQANREGATAIGLMLVSENIASINYRYPDTVENPDHMPGPIAQYWRGDGYEFDASRAPHVSAVAGLKALNGYEYQACEHPGWRRSEAYRFVEALKDCLIGALPGYDEAAWEISSTTA